MIIRTGKHFAPAVCEQLQERARDAHNTPVILLTQRHLGPEGKTEAQLAWDRFYVALNEEAVKAGLPAPAKDDDGDTINYGCDFKTGEILGWQPDEPPPKK